MRVHFHALAAGGEGVGRDETGRAVFAPFAAPEDTAEVEITEAKRAFARGRLLHLIEASPQRAVPPCPVFGACGGCQVQHLNYAAQLAAKTQIVRDALRRIGGFAEAPVEECVPSPAPLLYRNKAELHADADALGFFARESHDVVDVAHCPIQRDENNALLRFVRAQRDAGTLPLSFSGATLRVASGGATLLKISLRADDWPGAEEFAARALREVAGLAGVALEVRTENRSRARWLAGREWLEERVGGLRLHVSGFGFFQVNTSLTPRLVETVTGMAGAGEGRTALDVFCGVGLFGLHLARAGWTVQGVEASRAAVADAIGNAQRNKLTGARFTAGDAAEALKRWRGPLELVVLDPPRAGAAACMAALRKARPARLIYVSCDPATLARDLQTLGAEYQLARVVPFDLFPQTAHVETIALLERHGSSKR